MDQHVQKIYSFLLLTSLSWYRCTIQCWTFTCWRTSVLLTVWESDEQSWGEYVSMSFAMSISHLFLLEILSEHIISRSCCGSLFRVIRNCQLCSSEVVSFFSLTWSACATVSVAVSLHQHWMLLFIWGILTRVMGLFHSSWWQWCWAHILIDRLSFLWVLWFMYAQPRSSTVRSCVPVGIGVALLE